MKSINASLEAKVRLRSKGPLFELLQQHLKELPALLIVSQVEVLPFDGPVNSNDPEPFHVEILRADGKKCERCWNYSTHVGENPRYPTVCERCTEALAEIEGGASHAAV
jgi:isoleucyl-tRNA synthetase